MAIISIVIIVIDLAKGLTQNSSYLISNQNDDFVNSIIGGQVTIDSLRYIVLAVTLLYVLPLAIYSLVFCNLRTVG